MISSVGFCVVVRCSWCVCVCAPLCVRACARKARQGLPPTSTPRTHQPHRVQEHYKVLLRQRLLAVRSGQAQDPQRVACGVCRGWVISLRVGRATPSACGLLACPCPGTQTRTTHRHAPCCCFVSPEFSTVISCSCCAPAFLMRVRKPLNRANILLPLAPPHRRRVVVARACLGGEAAGGTSWRSWCSLQQ